MPSQVGTSVSRICSLWERGSPTPGRHSTSRGTQPDSVQGSRQGQRPSATRRRPLAGRGCDVETLTKDYYAAMDWDTTTGKPSKKKLEELGMHDVAAELYK